MLAFINQLSHAMLPNQQNKVQNGTGDICPYKSDKILPTLSDDMISKISGYVLNSDKDVVEFIKNNDPPAKIVPYSGKFISSKKRELYLENDFEETIYAYKRECCDVKDKTIEIMHALYGDKGKIECQYKKNIFLSKKDTGFLHRCLFKAFGMKLNQVTTCIYGNIPDDKDLKDVIKYINNQNDNFKPNIESSISDIKKSGVSCINGLKNFNFGSMCKYKCQFANVAAICDTKTYKIACLLRSSIRIDGKPEFIPNSKCLVSVSKEKQIVWDVETGLPLYTLSGCTGAICKDKSSPDGTKIVATLPNNTVIVLNVKNGEIVHSLSGHTDAVKKVKFSPDGKHLVSVSKKEAIVWDVETGCSLYTLSSHTDTVNKVEFSPDGKYLISVSHKEVIVWNVETENIVNITRDRFVNIGLNLYDYKFNFDGTKIIINYHHSYGVKAWDYKWNKKKHIKWLLDNLRPDQAEIIRQAFKANQVGTPLIIGKDSEELVLLGRLPRDKQQFLKKYLDIRIRQSQSYMKFIWRRFCRIFQASRRYFSRLSFGKRCALSCFIFGCYAWVGLSIWTKFGYRCQEGREISI